MKSVTVFIAAVFIFREIAASEKAIQAGSP